MAKFFGKALFEKKVPPTLYDFAQHGLLRTTSGDYGAAAAYVTINELGVDVPKKASKPAKKKPEAPKATPKELFELKTLNQVGFSINTETAYLATEIDTLHGKLDILGKAPKHKKDEPIYIGGDGEPGAVKYGRLEVQSMIERLENRYAYADFADRFSEWPYTMNNAIRELLINHSHLEAEPAAEMIPDLPREAIQAIKKYTGYTLALCGKHPQFYLIREKKEQKQIARKRDPILLAQSPFGFFWQILGAWDKEVVFLEEL